VFLRGGARSLASTVVVSTFSKRIAVPSKRIREDIDPWQDNIFRMLPKAEILDVGDDTILYAV
jgi:hypothetical protein